MSFHDMVRLVHELEEIHSATASLGSRLRSAQERLEDLDVVPAGLDDALAGLSAAARGTLRLAETAGGAEVRLRATIHVPSVTAWRRLEPLAGAFAEHEDWNVEMTAPREIVADLVQTATVPVVALDDWLASGLLTDVSVCVKRYDDEREQDLRAASWASVLLPLYQLPEQAHDYWRVLGVEPLPYAAPNGSPAFATRLASGHAGRTRLLWCPASYDEFFGGGVDSTAVIELARDRGLQLLWFVGEAATGRLRAEEQAYLGEIVTALVEEGTAIIVEPGDLDQAIDEAAAFCGGTTDLAELFLSMGRGVLREPTAVELDRVLTPTSGAAAPEALGAERAARFVAQIRDAFAGEFLGTRM